MFLTSQIRAQNNDSLQQAIGNLSYSDKVSALIAYGKSWQNRNPSYSLERFRQAYDIAEKSGEGQLMVKAGKNLAAQNFSLGNILAAREVYTKILSITAEKSTDRADVLYALGNLAYAQGNIVLAVQQYLESLKLYEFNRQNNGMLNAYVALGSLYSRQNNFSKAIEYNLKALRIFEASKDRFSLLSRYENIGSIYLNNKQYGQAQVYYLKALRLYRELGNRAGEAITLEKLGQLNFEQRNYEKSKDYFTQSLQIAERANAKPLMAATLNQLGEVCLVLQDNASAERHFIRSLRIAKELGLKIEQEEAYNGLNRVYQLSNENLKAKAFQALSNSIQDSLFNDSILRSITDMQLLYESQKKQSQIELLKTNEQLKNADLKFKNEQLQRERQIRNYLLVLVGLLLISGSIFMYFFSRNRRMSADLSKHYAELEIQKQELSRLNNVKDRFFSIISHDLRNNLTTVKLYFDLISNPGYVATDHSNMTRDIAASVENNIDLLENLLVWASAEIKGIALKAEELNLNNLVEQNIGLLRSSAQAKQISLVNLTDEKDHAYADRNMINLVLRNLISNAIKFTRPHGEVTISSELEGLFLKTTVIDNGVGISSEKLKVLFTQHSNSSTKGTGNEKGTGLGLLLCKDFVERNGGRIWVESEEGKGSCFTFTLPVDKPQTTV